MPASSLPSTDPTAGEVVERTDSRCAPRTNVLLAATIDVDGRTEAVRIRDLSETGALLEGRNLPGQGKTFKLRRLHFETIATVAWRNDSRCGVKLEEPIVVRDWIGGTRGTGPALSGQSRVDDLQAAVRAGASETRACAERRPDPQRVEDKLDERLAEELAYVVRLLQAMGTELGDDLFVLQRHQGLLQKFDVASQLLGHLAGVLKAEDRVAAIEAIGMEDLRARLLKKRLFTPLH